MGKEAKILVVDDDELIADLLAEWLKKKGHRVHAAYGGRQGLEAFEKGKYDLVITDLMMPEMDGIALIEAVKKRDPRMAVLMLSGLGTIEKAVEAIKKGAYDFVTKPVDFQVFQETIDRALERRDLFRQLSLFRRLTIALVLSLPFWLILGILISVWR